MFVCGYFLIKWDVFSFQASFQVTSVSDDGSRARSPGLISWLQWLWIIFWYLGVSICTDNLMFLPAHNKGEQLPLPAHSFSYSFIYLCPPCHFWYPSTSFQKTSHYIINSSLADLAKAFLVWTFQGCPHISNGVEVTTLKLSFQKLNFRLIKTSQNHFWCLFTP